MSTLPAQALAADLAERFGRGDRVCAVVPAGLSTTFMTREVSNVDLYIHRDREMPSAAASISPGREVPSTRS